MRIRLLELLIQVRHQGFNLGLLLNPKIWTTSSDFFVFAWLKLASWAKHGLNKLFAPISPNIQTAKTITDLWAPATGKKTTMQDRVGCCVFH